MKTEERFAEHFREIEIYSGNKIKPETALLSGVKEVITPSSFDGETYYRRQFQAAVDCNGWTRCLKIMQVYFEIVHFLILLAGF